MRPTSDERRKVAEKLRESAQAGEYLDQSIAKAILSTMSVSEVYLRPIGSILADLIDPTCKVVQKKVYAGGPQMYKTLWCCSECGFPLAESKYKGHIPFVADSFCQRCGARVVRDNERCYKDSHR